MTPLLSRDGRFDNSVGDPSQSHQPEQSLRANSQNPASIHYQVQDYCTCAKLSPAHRITDLTTSGWLELPPRLHSSLVLPGVTIERVVVAFES
jgi:hypothetical protein